jgi:hypothetical protein
VLKKPEKVNMSLAKYIDMIRKRRDIEYLQKRVDRYELALSTLATMETPKANGTVRNMAKVARQALEADDV